MGVLVAVVQSHLVVVRVGVSVTSVLVLMMLVGKVAAVVMGLGMMTVHMVVTVIVVVTVVVVVTVGGTVGVVMVV